MIGCLDMVHVFCLSTFWDFLHDEAALVCVCIHSLSAVLHDYFDSRTIFDM